MGCSMPGFLVLHYLPELAQTLSHWCHPTISCSVIPFSSCPQSFPAPGSFKWVSSSHQVAKVVEFQLQNQSYQWTPRTNLRTCQTPPAFCPETSDTKLWDIWGNRSVFRSVQLRHKGMLISLGPFLAHRKHELRSFHLLRGKFWDTYHVVPQEGLMGFSSSHQ